MTTTGFVDFHHDYVIVSQSSGGRCSHCEQGRSHDFWIFKNHRCPGVNWWISYRLRCVKCGDTSSICVRDPNYYPSTSQEFDLMMYNDVVDADLATALRNLRKWKDKCLVGRFVSGQPMGLSTAEPLLVLQEP